MGRTVAISPRIADVAVMCCGFVANKVDCVENAPRYQQLSAGGDASFVLRVCVRSAPLHQAEDEIVRLKASEEALDKLMDDYHEHIEKVRCDRLQRRDIVARCAMRTRVQWVGRLQAL